MPSETERITHEVMDRLDLCRLEEHPGGAPSQKTEVEGHAEIDSNYTNKVYQELERPSRISSNYLCGILRHMLEPESFSDRLEKALSGAPAEADSNGWSPMTPLEEELG